MVADDPCIGPDPVAPHEGRGREPWLGLTTVSEVYRFLNAAYCHETFDRSSEEIDALRRLVYLTTSVVPAPAPAARPSDFPMLRHLAVQSAYPASGAIKEGLAAIDALRAGDAASRLRDGATPREIAQRLFDAALPFTVGGRP